MRNDHRKSFLRRINGPNGKAVANAENAWLELMSLRRLFGFSSVEYDRHDIMDLVTHANIPLAVQPRAVPIDPTKQMRPRNVAIVRQVSLFHTIHLGFRRGVQITFLGWRRRT